MIRCHGAFGSHHDQHRGCPPRPRWFLRRRSYRFRFRVGGRIHLREDREDRSVDEEADPERTEDEKDEQELAQEGVDGTGGTRVGRGEDRTREQGTGNDVPVEHPGCLSCFCEEHRCYYGFLLLRGATEVAIDSA